MRSHSNVMLNPEIRAVEERVGFSGSGRKGRQISETSSQPNGTRIQLRRRSHRARPLMQSNSTIALLALVIVLVLSACAVAVPEAPAAEAPAAEIDYAEVAAPEGDPASYAVDAAASEVIWIGSNIVGHEQIGTVAISEGTLDFIGTTLTGGSITIDMTSMSSSNLPATKAPELIGHLSSEDFFEVNTYPTAVFAFKSAAATDVANQYLVTANLTIKDVTDELTFVTDVTVEEGSLTGTTDFTFDRTQWGVIYGSGSFFDGLGDRVINDEVQMQITLVANQS